MTGTKNDGKYEIYDTKKTQEKRIERLESLSRGQLIAVMLLPEIQFDWDRTYFL